MENTPIRLKLEATPKQHFASSLETKRGSTRFWQVSAVFNSCALALVKRRKMILLKEDISHKFGDFTRGTVEGRVEAEPQSCIIVSV